MALLSQIRVIILRFTKCNMYASFFILFTIAFPADIGRKPAAPARGSRQHLHAGKRYMPVNEMNFVSLNIWWHPQGA